MDVNTVRGDRAAVAEALGDVGRTLGVDGYRLDVEAATTTRLNVTIVALDGACEECLAPAEVLKMIISAELEGGYSTAEIDLRLPASPHP